MCLRGWFQTCLSKQLELQDEIPDRLKERPFTAAKLRELFEERHIYALLYSCPFCRASVFRKLIEVIALKDFITAANDILGLPEEVAMQDPNFAAADIWADVFYKRT